MGIKREAATEGEDEETKEQRKERKRLKKELKREKGEKKRRKHNNADDYGASKPAPSIATSHEARQKTSVDDAKAVLYHKKVIFVVSLLPAALKNVQMSVEDSLRSMLLKHSDAIGGVLLAFENVQIQTDSPNHVAGMIINELPYIHFNVAADALVFVPKPGCALTGAVTEVSFHSHVALVVHHYFNASISAEHMRSAGFAFDDVQLQWYRESDQRPLSSSDHIVFDCEKLFESGGMISIEGSKPCLLQTRAE